MCLTMLPAHFEKTRLASLVLPNERVLMIYSNEAENKSSRDTNTMFLAIRCKDINSIEVHDMKNHANVIPDLERLFTDNDYLNDSYNASEMRGFIGKGIMRKTAGRYTCDYSNNIEDLLTTLKIGNSKKAEFVNFYKSRYKPNSDFVFLAFSWSGNELMSSEPIAVSYSGNKPYFPMLDAHNGNIPDMKELVTYDHKLFMSFAKNNIDHKSLQYYKLPEKLGGYIIQVFACNYTLPYSDEPLMNSDYEFEYNAENNNIYQEAILH